MCVGFVAVEGAAKVRGRGVEMRWIHLHLIKTLEKDLPIRSLVTNLLYPLISSSHEKNSIQCLHTEMMTTPKVYLTFEQLYRHHLFSLCHLKCWQNTTKALQKD